MSKWIRYNCPTCGSPLESLDSWCGQTDRCPVCSTEVIVPTTLFKECAKWLRARLGFVQLKLAYGEEQLRRYAFTLDVAKRKFEFNIRWKEASNKIALERQRTVLEMAKIAFQNGECLTTIFALLVRSAVAERIICDKNDTERLSTYERMTPQQIAASRATDTTLADGFKAAMMPPVMAEKICALAEQVQDLKVERQTLTGALEASQRRQYKEDPIIERCFCAQCAAVRTIKNGQCLTCGATRK